MTGVRRDPRALFILRARAAGRTIADDGFARADGRMDRQCRRSEPAPPARGSLLYDPQVRAIVYQVVLIVVVVFLVYEAATNAIDEPARGRASPPGFGFLERHGRLRHQPEPDPVQRRELDLRRRLPGRAPQHAARRRDRHRPRDDPRLRRSASRGCRRTGSSRKLATVYVELIRNIPLLLQLCSGTYAVLTAAAAAARVGHASAPASSSTSAACSCRSRSSRAAPGS